MAVTISSASAKTVLEMAEFFTAYNMNKAQNAKLPKDERLRALKLVKESASLLNYLYDKV